MEDKERKLRELNTQITARGIRLKDLEAEWKNIEQRKISCLADIKRLQDSIKNLQVERDKLKQENDSFRKEIKDARYAVAGEWAKLDQEKKKLADTQIANDDKAKVLETQINITKKQELSAKEKTKKLTEETNNLARSREDLANREKVLNKEKAVYEKEKEKDKSSLNTDKKKTQENLDNSLHLKEKYEAKLKETESKTAELQKETNVLKARQKAADDAKFIYEAKQKEADVALQRAKQKELSIGRLRASLDQREKEIEIKRLRVEKNIREKNIQKELEQLKKETA